MLYRISLRFGFMPADIFGRFLSLDCSQVYLAVSPTSVQNLNCFWWTLLFRGQRCSRLDLRYWIWIFVRNLLEFRSILYCRIVLSWGSTVLSAFLLLSRRLQVMSVSVCLSEWVKWIVRIAGLIISRRWNSFDKLHENGRIVFDLFIFILLFFLVILHKNQVVLRQIYRGKMTIFDVAMLFIVFIFLLLSVKIIFFHDFLKLLVLDRVGLWQNTPRSCLHLFDIVVIIKVKQAIWARFIIRILLVFIDCSRAAWLYLQIGICCITLPISNPAKRRSGCLLWARFSRCSTIVSLINSNFALHLI